MEYQNIAGQLKHDAETISMDFDMEGETGGGYLLGLAFSKTIFPYLGTDVREFIDGLKTGFEDFPEYQMKSRR